MKWSAESFEKEKEILAKSQQPIKKVLCCGYAAAMRHMEAWRIAKVKQELFDDELKTHHLANAATCLMFLTWFDLQNSYLAGTKHGDCVHFIDNDCHKGNMPALLRGNVDVATSPSCPKFSPSNLYAARLRATR